MLEPSLQMIFFIISHFYLKIVSFFPKEAATKYQEIGSFATILEKI